MKEKGDNIRRRHSTFVSYPLPAKGGTPPILRETAKMQRDTQRMSSYPLPAKGGTPPILRGECHADNIQHCISAK